MQNAAVLALKGALIGTGAILPGVSGGVLSVVLGVYRPMLALLAHPLRELRSRWRFFLPLLVGFGLGVLALSRLLAWLFRASPAPAVWLFVGLIAGTLPALWREAGQQGRPSSAIAAGLAAFALTLAGLWGLSLGREVQVAPSAWTWLLCGGLWGVGLVAPGLSPSAVFLLLGVYQPMTEAIAGVSLPVLLPMGAGLAAAALTLSRAVSLLLKRWYPQTMQAVLGVTLASTVMLVPRERPGDGGAAGLCGLCLLLGLALAGWMGRLEAGARKEKESPASKTIDKRHGNSL